MLRGLDENQRTPVKRRKLDVRRFDSIPLYEPAKPILKNKTIEEPEEEAKESVSFVSKPKKPDALQFTAKKSSDVLLVPKKQVDAERPASVMSKPKNE